MYYQFPTIDKETPITQEQLKKIVKIYILCNGSRHFYGLYFAALHESGVSFKYEEYEYVIDQILYGKWYNFDKCMEFAQSVVDYETLHYKPSPENLTYRLIDQLNKLTFKMRAEYEGNLLMAFEKKVGRKDRIQVLERAIVHGRPCLPYDNSTKSIKAQICEFGHSFNPPPYFTTFFRYMNFSYDEVLTFKHTIRKINSYNLMMYTNVYRNIKKYPSYYYILEDVLEGLFHIEWLINEYTLLREHYDTHPELPQDDKYKLKRFYEKHIQALKDFYL